MPKRYAKKTTKVYRKRKTAVKRFTRTLNAMRGNTAEVVETNTSTFEVGGVVNANTLYLANIVLGQFARSISVSKAYRFYRIRTVKYVYKPYANLYTAGGSATIPQLYTIMNRTGDSVAFNLEDLKDQGAKPRQWTKTLNVKYAPSTVITVASAGSITPAPVQVNAMQSGSKKWLSTTDTAVLYWGHYFWIDGDVSSAPQGTLDIEIEVDFKEPNVEVSGTEAPVMQV